jgi:hypothetical protein
MVPCRTSLRFQTGGQCLYQVRGCYQVKSKELLLVLDRHLMDVLPATMAVLLINTLLKKRVRVFHNVSQPLCISLLYVSIVGHK